MALSRVELDNFTVFHKLDIVFDNGINVILGENGVGKTHLLKILYATSEISRNDKKIDNISKYFQGNLEDGKFFTKVEKPLFARVYDQNKEMIEDKQYLTVNKEKISYTIGVPKEKQTSVFIPVTEMLSHSNGFLSLNKRYKLPFDETQVDIIVNASLPETREISTLSQIILDEISNIIEGTVVFENDNFYVLKSNGTKTEYALEAEGFRKLGLLWKLVRNGLLEKGTILFWDEPESNINPELIPVLVDILIKLQREGIQIFIATHSYNLAKYFEIKRQKKDSVVFYNLVKETNNISVQIEKYLGDLNNNKVIEADEKLLDEIYEKNLED